VRERGGGGDRDWWAKQKGADRQRDTEGNIPQEACRKRETHRTLVSLSQEPCVAIKSILEGDGACLIDHPPQRPAVCRVREWWDIVVDSLLGGEDCSNRRK